MYARLGVTPNPFWAAIQSTNLGRDAASQSRVNHETHGYMKGMSFRDNPLYKESVRATEHQTTFALSSCFDKSARSALGRYVP
jgi:hypothetical protein